MFICCSPSLSTNHPLALHSSLDLQIVLCRDQEKSRNAVANAVDLCAKAPLYTDLGITHGALIISGNIYY